MHVLPPALAPLSAYRQFLIYRLVPSAKTPGRTEKIPYSPFTMRPHNAHDSTHWVSAAEACALSTSLGAEWGVAFTFTKEAGFFFIDIDHARDPATGQWAPHATQLAAMFPGAAMELSQSGTGMHIFGRASPMLHGCKNEAWGLELYTEARFCALTGNEAMGNANSDHTAALAQVIAHYFPFSEGQDSNGDFTLSTEPVPEWNGPADDEDLLRRALASKSVAAKFGQGATFRDIFECNVDVLAQVYPDPSGYNASTVDAALASHLAFWTGRHGERIARLMWRSKLVRDKWNRPDYIPRTITEILARGGDVVKDTPLALPEHLQPRGALDEMPQGLAALAPVAAVVQGLGGPAIAITVDGAHMPPPDPSVPAMRPTVGATFVSGAEAMQLFKGCVYIKDEARALVPQCGRLKSDQFRVIYGGFTFAMDDANQRTTRNAWEAFTESQLMRPPMADTVCFRPDLPAGTIVYDAGRSRVNIYEPVETRRVVGDATPFWTHLFKVLPDERDRNIFMAYMAACVQHKGVKFQWAPLLQGVEGNGKTLFTRCVAEALGRRYVHWPKASKLSKEFNAWMVGKLLYGVEDIYTPHGKVEVIEELKPMITGGDGLEIEGKGVDQVSFDICGNFMFNSNHKDAVRKTRNDRRFCILYSPQQHHADLHAWGMDGDYFPKLYEWLRADGYAIVAEILHTYPIPDEFNPAKDCHRAPTTSSTEEAIGSTQGGIEQQIIESVQQGVPGFNGGWISSMALARLLDDLKQGQRITLNKRKDMLRALGYELHRALPDGRVNNAVQPDGRKTQLFIKIGHPDGHLTVPADVAKAYTAAQTVK